ncbi:MAG: hypothetical protein Q9166_003071 [cf. Caloplaca sp. 2 TL-2023]
MAYFLPSYFQKRILRYALSRLDLLDPKQLNLDNLDIAWGKRSVVELRDVGVQLKKLVSVLNLPPQLELVKASVKLLRVIVPADLYSSGIVAEVTGVEVHLKANQDSPRQTTSTPKDFEGTQTRKYEGTHHPGSLRPTIHDPGGNYPSVSPNNDGNGAGSDLAVLPTTDDLAKSFLQTESKEEKDQLQAAVAQSQHVDESQILDMSDDAAAVGVGDGLSLPAFLSGFLKGIRDRFRLSFTDVRVNVLLQIDVPSERSVTRASSDRSEKVTLRLSVKEIEFGRVPRSDTTSSEIHQSSNTTPPNPTSPPGALLWKRQIRLGDIQCAVLSDASMFSSLSRSFAPSSSSESTIARSPSKAQWKAHHPVYAPADAFADTDERATLQPPEDDDMNEGFSHGPPSGVSRISDCSTELDPVRDQHTLPRTTRSDPACLSESSIYEHDVLYESLQSAKSEYGSIYDQSRLPGRHISESLEKEAKSSESAYNPSKIVMSATKSPVPSGGERSRSLASSCPPSPIRKNSESPPNEDLAESKIFSHEEAESMYMSAMTNIYPADDNMNQVVPGAWAPHLEEEASAVTTGKTKGQSFSRRTIGESDSAGLQNTDRESVPFNAPNVNIHAVHSRDTDTTHRDKQLRSESHMSESIASATPEPLEAAFEGSLTVSKTFMVIDFISIDLLHTDVDTKPSADLRFKAKQRVPMAAPYREPPQIQTRLPEALTGAKDGEASFYGIGDSIPDSGLGASELASEAATSVEVGAVEFRSDMSLARLTALAMRQVRKDISTGRASEQKESKKNTDPPSRINLTVEKIAWKFYDRVVSLPANENLEPSAQLETKAAFVDAELLLRATVQGLESNLQTSTSSYSSKISMTKVVFGYANGDILAFDSSLKMRESTRDILAPIDRDMVLTISEDARTSKVEFSTLPLKVRLDLRRLDETFAWLGGFSTILDLGNSMISSVTKLDARVSAGKESRRFKRGVHFEISNPGQSANKEAAPGQGSRKVTARIGGLICTLEGTESSLRLEGTALKVVRRVEGLGMQLDRLHLNGLNLNDTVDQPAMSLRLSNVRMEYLAKPKEVDLARLLALLSPSKDNYEEDDDILLENLWRQRRQGGVIRVTAERSENHLNDDTDLRQFSTLLEELKKLGTVTKYLPEDDRPGILTLVLIRQFLCEAYVGQSFGSINSEMKNVEIAHVTLPSLFALGISNVRLCRNKDEELLAPVTPTDHPEESSSPMIMARFIGNEMEPTVKLKLQQIRVEYHVPFILAVMSINGYAQPEELMSDIAGSIVTLTGRQQDEMDPAPGSLREHFRTSARSSSTATATKIDVTIRDSWIGLNPRKSSARGVLVLTKTHFVGTIPKHEEVNAVLEVQKAALMIINDTVDIKPRENRPECEHSRPPVSQLHSLEDMGYVSVSSISAARVSLQIAYNHHSSSKSVDVEIKDDLFVLETCADSTQTLQEILNGLAPPLPQSKESRYRTEVVPIEDLLSSFSGNAFPPSEEMEGDNSESGSLPKDEEDTDDDEYIQDPDAVGSLFKSESSRQYGGISDSTLDDDSEALVIDRSVTDLQVESRIISEGLPIEFQDDHFGATTSVEGTAHRCDTKHNTYDLGNESTIRQSSVRVRVRDVHIIWNLFDGYDWQRTRDTIGKAILDIETKALDHLAKREKRRPQDVEDDEESVIGDFLFNSIYIGVSANRDPRNFSREVQRNLDDIASEADSSAPSTVTSSPSRDGRPSPIKSKKLRLARSKHHKMTFELKGISADVVVFGPGSGETQSSIDIRVQDLDIFDHVPTSTWKKFATYMYDAGERESGTSMIHLEILNVRPVPDLATTEIILKATILPLRLHVDQDALDFLTRFFEFKDDRTTDATSKPDTAFLQRVEINSIRVKLDFKPKRVNYAGIRSGHTNEFMNFFILDRADMVLRHVIIYGISGFDRLGKMLNDIWMPDIKGNQLPGVLAGLAPLRPLVNVGGGVRDLVVVPVREYQKDGRIIRSLQKGAMTFAKTTTGELVKLGAKLAIGTQTVLQGAEDLLTQTEQTPFEVAGGWEGAELDEEEKKRISLYADQPVGVIQGLRGGYASLERDLMTAKDAIVAMPGEVMESGTASGAAKAVLKGAPTIILRPALGVSKAVGQTLMGATNSLDLANRRRIEEAPTDGQSGSAHPNPKQQVPFANPFLERIRHMDTLGVPNPGPKACLSPRQRRANHTFSETKRRNRLRAFSWNLCQLVPELTIDAEEKCKSERLVLDKTREFARATMLKRNELLDALGAQGINAEKETGLKIPPSIDPKPKYEGENGPARKESKAPEMEEAGMDGDVEAGEAGIADNDGERASAKKDGDEPPRKRQRRKAMATKTEQASRRINRK